MGVHRLIAATPDHLGALMDLYEAFAQERGHAATKAQLQAFADAVFTATQERTEFPIVAVVGKKVVGFLWVSAVPGSYEPLGARLHSRLLYVRPEFRCHPRIGHDLYAYALRLQASIGLPITLQTAYERKEVARWERKAFRPVGVLMAREAPKETARG